MGEDGFGAWHFVGTLRTLQHNEQWQVLDVVTGPGGAAGTAGTALPGVLARTCWVGHAVAPMVEVTGPGGTAGTAGTAHARSGVLPRRCCGWEVVVVCIGWVGGWVGHVAASRLRLGLLDL